MKIFLVCCLVITGALSFPQNERTGKYIDEDASEFTNVIDESYDVDKKQTEKLPALSLPVFLYKEIMNMQPSQVQYTATMMKPLIKPILTSVELRIVTDFLEETLRLFKNDPDVKASLREGVDALQNMVESSEGDMVEQFLTWVVSLYSDEDTARSFSSLLSDVSPTIRSWVVDPVKSYYRSYITPTLESFTRTLNSFFGPDLLTNEIARSGGRWSTIVDMYIERMADMTSMAKSVIRELADFLEKQDSGDF